MKRWICGLCGQTVTTHYTVPTPPICTHRNTPRANAKACPMNEDHQ